MHVDSAYGGYFTLAENLETYARAAYNRISEADSIVIDPHKHGLQPYGCGCVLFRDPSVGALYKHDSPYTYFTQADFSSRRNQPSNAPGAGSSAVALWATQQLLPLARGGEFAHMLEGCHQTAVKFSELLSSDQRWITPLRTRARHRRLGAARRNRRENLRTLAARLRSRRAEQNLHLAMIHLPVELFANAAGKPDWPEKDGTVLCLRSVLMKPEHRDWLPRIWEILSSAADSALR